MACTGTSRLCVRACQWRKCSITKKNYSFFSDSSSSFFQTIKKREKCHQSTVIPAIATVSRNYSTSGTYQTGPMSNYEVQPYTLLENDLKDVYTYIRGSLRQNTHLDDLYEISTYYFDGKGKAIRPMIALMMAKAMNYHIHKEDIPLLPSQREVGMISEMIHTASLIHDDVIDQSDSRRGKPSVNVMWNQKKVTMAGDYILAVASMLIAKLRNNDVTLVLSQVVNDLVQGEFMQLGSKESENERFDHYLNKTYKKTASLMANSIKAVTILAGADEELCNLSFAYGKNLGLGFQLVDDLLDFVASSAAMGKPTAADLKLGLATAPVLFACEKFPELNPMIMRRFQEPGDVERAFELVHKSDGLEQTKYLAKKYCEESFRLAQTLTESPYQKGLIVTADYVLKRMK
ncbi:all trans-polyprenyl-diphosphate synthase PDSS1 [Coccinella septempunctata]|uniref:all trans-polyprenyl-diphosphate synthase PDSS1 n=1 Tax=Coccinella septempunctata TaxID=41139 RepID=UPI001D07C4EE|nr:all trans-polyprenyl-diphosphate synthase PDSS1 [Coccinella septempunctata]